ncbi:hypothetical protein ABH941_007295 [Streptacidiphilus sp. EB103A]
MEPAVTTVALAAVSGVATLGMGWLKARVQQRRAREESRRQYVRTLPAYSRIIDLGEHGIMIEVGAREGGAGGSR